MRQARIGFAHRGGERVDDAALDTVGEMAGIGNVLEAAPAVRDFLVLGQRVGDQGEGAQILAEGRGQRLGGAAAHFAIGILQAIEGRLQRQFLAVDVEAKVGHRLVEQAVPGAASGDRFLVEKLLDAVLELVGLVHSEVEHPGPVVAESGIAGECAFDRSVVDQVQFEREEQEMRAGIGHLLLDVAIELGALRIGGVAGIDQAGIGDDAADQFLQRLVGDQRLAQLAGAAAPGLGGERSLPAGLEGDRIGGGFGDVPLQFRRFHAGIEVGKVPFRQIAKLGRALTGRRCRKPPTKHHAHRQYLL